MVKRYEIEQVVGNTAGLLSAGYDMEQYLKSRDFWRAEFAAGNEQGEFRTAVYFDTASVLWDESMRRDADRDYAIMAELAQGSAEIGRATLAPVTLATIGLDATEMRAIAAELAAEQTARANDAADLEWLAMAHKVLCAHKRARLGSVEFVTLEGDRHESTFASLAARDAMSCGTANVQEC